MIKLFIQGVRPKTLIAGIAPSACSYFLYLAEGNPHQIFILSMCLGLAICIQIATNFYNDAIDFEKGTDINRVGPKRVTGAENLTSKSVFRIGHFFILLAFIFGIPLVVKGGVIFLLMGLLSLFLAYGYTGGPFPLAYLGLGELFVFIFFGFVATSGSYYLYSGNINISVIMLSIQLGLLSSVLIGVNNYRDRKTDVLTNKNTLATKLTEFQYLKLMDLFIFIPFVILLYFVFTVKLSFFIPMLAIGYGHQIRHNLRFYSEESELNYSLGLAGKMLGLFSILFCLGSLWE